MNTLGMIILSMKSKKKELVIIIIIIIIKRCRQVKAGREWSTLYHYKDPAPQY